MDVKEGHCWRCEAPGTDVSCEKCNKAKYCGDKCRNEDNERHGPQCEIWKPAICSNPNCTVSEGLKQCTSCSTSLYCSDACQRKHWSQHKQICRQRLTTIQEKSKSMVLFFCAYRYKNSTLALAVPYYTGNVIAVDMLHLQTNELVDAGDAVRILRQDYSILSAGCGNLRNLIYTITSLPEEFQGKLSVTLNDIDPFIQARNVLFLFMMTHYACDSDIASKITTIWYSLHLPKDVHEFLMKCLKMLFATNAARLKITTHSIVDVSQENYDALRRVWQGWIKVDQQQASGQSQSIKEQRNEAYFGDGEDLNGALGYLSSFKFQIPERHGKSIASWVFNGDFLSSGKTAECGHLNPTLSGKRNRGLSTSRPTGVPETSSEMSQSPSEVQFEFCVPLNLMPFADWDYRQASKFSNDDSLLVMYHAYVTNQIKDAITFATGGRLAIQVNLGNCMKITEGQMKDDRFDRIFTSNLVDYIGTKILLDTMKPLLNTVNKNAVIVTQYWNWHQYFPLSKADNQLHQQNGNAWRWIQSARRDTKLVLFNTPSQHYYQEYFNNTPYFIDYLRADLKACRYIKETDDVSCKKIPTFGQVKQCSDGLRMRDFRQDLNKVAPWRYRCNVRAVNMLPGYSRCLEWYLI